ncbi:MAG: NADH-quinone oxidoreductase subunit J [Frankiaceae bacterium]
MSGLMTGAVVAQAITHTTGWESAVFYVLGTIAVLAALGLVLAKNAVHCLLMLVVVQFCLAVFYFVQDAPFLGVVQVIVYAGAIMVLFLFVIMLIGIDSSDSLVEVLRGQRVAAVVLGLGFAGLIVFPIGSAIAGTSAAGLGAANGAGNVQGIARLLFTNYVFAFEIVSALLIIAAVGAMVLGHRERAPRPTQRELSERRIAGEHPSAWTGPGIYARHDAVDSPALLPDGSPSRASLPEDMSQEDMIDVIERVGIEK